MTAHFQTIHNEPAALEHDVPDVFTFIRQRAGEAEHDPHGLRPEVARMARAGLLSACLPRSCGGKGLGLDADSALSTFELLRDLGQASLSVGRLFEGHVNAVKLVNLYGSPAVKAQIFHAVKDGALLGVWGADGPRPLRYVRRGEMLKLEGEKRFASGLGAVRYAVVTLHDKSDDKAPAQLAVIEVSDRSRQHPDEWTATGMRATLSGRFDFDGLVILASQCLGAPGDYEREPHFEGGIWRYCAVHLGGAQALLDHWREALQACQRLDDPLQLTRFMRAATLIRAMESLIRDTAVRVETSGQSSASDVSDSVAQALMARQFTEESCVEIMALAEKSLGTFAHMSGHIERIRRDLSIYIRQANPDAKLLKAGRLLFNHEHGQ